jgi:hypothetical protein
MSISSYTHNHTRISVGSQWLHHTNRRLYTVLSFTNLATTKPDKFPKTVVYSDADGNVWSRPMESWLEAMSLVQ